MPTIVLWAITVLIWAWYLVPRRRAPLPVLWFIARYAAAGGGISVLAAYVLEEAGFAWLGVGPGRPVAAMGTLVALSAMVGVIEEGAKAATAAVLMHSTGRLREPLDGVLGATAVALGFASLENLLYANNLGAFTLVPRAFTAVPLHLGLATIWGFAWTRARLLGLPLARSLLPAVLGAAAIHATYDFLLMAVDQPALLFYGLLAFSVFMFRYIARRLREMQAQSPEVPAGLCLTCGHRNPAAALYCGQCGADLEREFYAVCHACGTRTDKTAHFCPHCGQTLEPNGETSEGAGQR